MVLRCQLAPHRVILGSLVVITSSILLIVMANQTMIQCVLLPKHYFCRKINLCRWTFPLFWGGTSATAVGSTCQLLFDVMANQMEIPCFSTKNEHGCRENMSCRCAHPNGRCRLAIFFAHSQTPWCCYQKQRRFRICHFSCATPLERHLSCRALLRIPTRNVQIGSKLDLVTLVCLGTQNGLSFDLPRGNWTVWNRSELVFDHNGCWFKLN